MTRSEQQKQELKHKAAFEAKKLAAIALYLFLVITALEIFKLSILKQYEAVQFRLGYNAIEALILAKVVLIGDLLHLGERFRGYPAIVSTVAKSVSFALFVGVFTLLETFVEKLAHGEGMAASLQAVMGTDFRLLAVHLGILFLNFVPLFAMWECARVIGEEKAIDMFFKRPVQG